MDFLYLCQDMEESQRAYIAIDLKSFYASVECVERGLDPLSTHLVVADGSRTEKTICLAVSPSLKAFGIGGRARLFEVVQRVRAVNRQRLDMLPDQWFKNKSTSAVALAAHPDWEVDYITAPPRMAYYIEYSCRIFNIYRKYVAAEDIHVYSIDEVFMDVTHYLQTYGVTAHELARRMIGDVLQQTGITATAGIGTNLYLSKVAMDIVAKHATPDADGVRIAELDEMTYRQQLWNHRPLSDFWRVGHGTAQRLAAHGLLTMGQIARCSTNNEELLYRLFGVNAELLIDHAWGWEPCTIDWIKRYRPESSSLSSSQVLAEPYTFDKARIVLQEMADAVALELVDKHMVANQFVLTVNYDVSNLKTNDTQRGYHGAVTLDYYGRSVPKSAHGTANLEEHTASSRRIVSALTDLFDRIVNRRLSVRRLTIGTNHVVDEQEAAVSGRQAVQLELFADNETRQVEHEAEQLRLEREHAMQQSLLEIKKKYGRNAILKGLDFEEGATARQRNEQIGGHKA
ncbi:MAG: DNA polymerase V [bacterium P3]|nr:MAG: DNA polymerase V [bacterium P3]KWW42174.1 MAG: DNA polymerase V [bacterium F083]